MPADASGHLLVMGLEVTDRDGYARYRAGMRPILASYGGSFRYDFEVAAVLEAPGEARLNRVFAIAFPDREARRRFFDDPRYRAVRAEHFEPSVGAIATIAEADGRA